MNLLELRLSSNEGMRKFKEIINPHNYDDLISYYNYSNDVDGESWVLDIEGWNREITSDYEIYGWWTDNHILVHTSDWWIVEWDDTLEYFKDISRMFII